MRHKYGQASLRFSRFCQRQKTARMVTVLVRNQNRINRSKAFADSRKPLRDLPPAQARVNQQSCSTGCDESRVPPAAAPEYADLDDKNSCERPILKPNSRKPAETLRLFLSVISEFPNNFFKIVFFMSFYNE